MTGKLVRLGAAVGVIAATLMMTDAAEAQTATSTIRGEAPPNAVVRARNVDSGFTTRDTADSDGDYALPGLQPGVYDVTVETAAGPVTQRVRVLIGQTATLNLAAAAPAEEEVITVIGRRLDDPTTPTVGTNVTREQIEALPQTTRNFVNFAALAPGVRATSESSGEVTFSSGGQQARAVNVFIDGQSQKAQIIDGGVAGQDDSRGNPFPQLAVQEFRVLTQNFSAEFDQSSSAIITAVTRSGSNDFEIEGFAAYQPSDWITYHNLSGFAPSGGDPEEERQQFGVAFGGPIIRDRLHFFTTYEGRRDDKFSSVTLGRSGYEDRFGQFQGNVAIPFEEDIFFGKLSWQISPDQSLDFSATYREERDIRDVGGQDAIERANVLDIDETKFNLRHQWQIGDFFNSFQIDWLDSTYNPTAQNFGDIGEQHVVFRDADLSTPDFDFNFDAQDATIIRIGGRDSNQNIQQQSLTIKDDLSLPDFDLGGVHDIRIGGRVTFNTYFVEKEFNRNPFFTYDADGRPEINGDPAIPVRVVIGSPVPAADIENTVYGVYIQDDWRVTNRLELNLGLRWDYEDNAYNNDYTTPDNIVALLDAYRNLPGYTLPFNPDDYISDGERDAFTEAWQPRLGFSYDLSAANDESTVLFGGAGRYYDRIPYNFAFDERFKPTQFVTQINFSADGARPGTVAWDPAYATAEGLQELIDANPGAGEVFLIRNGAEPPVTDQFNLGLRQRFGDWRTSVTLAHAESRNGFGWYIGNLGTGPDPRFNGPTPASLGFSEFRNLVFISNHDQERSFHALYLTADKPYTDESRWGVSVSYTLSHAYQNGSRDTGTAPFDFDYATIDLTPTYNSPNDERHRIVASGIIGLPWDVRLSTLITLGTGQPFNVFVNGESPHWFSGRPLKDDFLIFPDVFAYQQIDLRVSKTFEIGEDHDVEIYLDVLNATDHPNVAAADYEGFLGDPSNPNSAFGLPRPATVRGRALQIGARARW